MKKSNPAKLIFSFLGLATFASLVGTVSGTLAWYTYSTRATVSYSGTSVSNTVQLQIGIASPSKVLSVNEATELVMNDEFIEKDEEKQRIISSFVEFWNVMEETKWNDDNNYYYFAPVGSGLSSPCISAYLKSNGYATNTLAAVTTGSYSRGDDFSLKISPNPDPRHNSLPAKQSYYAYIPFVFRVIRTNTNEENKFEGDVELWLTDAQVRASSVDDGEIYKAIRMYVDRGNDYEDDFILNPSAQGKGSTVVAGVLDLTRDNYYDYDADGNEILYGEYETISERKSSYEGADEIADLNGTGKTGEDYDTFTAKHRPGINYFESYENCVFKTAEYESLSTIKPIKDEQSGALRNRDEQHPSSVCKTKGEAGHFLGRVDMTVYLEGWDHNVIDQEYEHAFDLGLTFEINKLGE